jgi:hypothetical protein
MIKKRKKNEGKTEKQKEINEEERRKERNIINTQGDEEK